LKTIKENKYQQGLTLIELVILMMILGIIATISYTRYMDLSHTANIAQCKSNQQHLCTAQEIFWVQSSINSQEAHYADDIQDLVPYTHNGEIPKCPENGEYQILNENIIICSIPEHSIR